MAHRGSGTRQKKEWNGLGTSSVNMTANGTFIAGTLAFAIPGTVLRIIGEYTISPTGSIVDGDRAIVSVGIGQFSTDAVALGATAMPDPEDEPEFPWLYYKSHSLVYRGASTVGNELSAGSLRQSIDIRSMRKFKPRESFSVVLEYDDLAGTPAVTFQMGVMRVLFGT